MAPCLQNLSDELLHNISHQIAPPSREVCFNDFNDGAIKRKGTFSKVLSPEWKGLRSLRQTCKKLRGPATEALSAAEKDCKTIVLNLVRGIQLYRPSSPLFGDCNKKPGATYPDRMSRLHITIPLKFFSESHPEKDGSGLVMACILTFDKKHENRWECTSTTDYNTLSLPLCKRHSEFLLPTYENIALELEKTIRTQLDRGETLCHCTLLRVIRALGMEFNSWRWQNLYNGGTEMLDHNARPEFWTVEEFGTSTLWLEEGMVV
jgi:hypothetical protein